MRIADTIIFGKAFLSAKRNFRRWSRREDMVAWQNNMVARHIERLLPFSPFIAARIGTDWRTAPICTKKDAMENFQSWNTRSIPLCDALSVAIKAEETRDFTPKIAGLTVGLSSGTTGARGVFLASGEETAMWAGTVLARVLRGIKPQRAALFMRAGSNLYSATQRRGFAFKFFDIFLPLESHLAELDKFSPTILVAPPSILSELAGLPVKWRVRQVISIADVLEDADRSRINSAFGVACDEIYQATEGFLAATCPAGNLHWNEDAIYLEKEWIDNDSYHPIITDFRRTTQPIIRYRLDDIISHETCHCPCGSIFARIGHIAGRSDEIIYLTHKTSGEPTRILPDFIRRAVVLALPTQSEYRVIQTSPVTFDVQLSAPQYFPKVRASISALCDNMGTITPAMTLKPYMAPRPTEKRRRVIRLK